MSRDKKAKAPAFRSYESKDIKEKITRYRKELARVEVLPNSEENRRRINEIKIKLRALEDRLKGPRNVVDVYMSIPYATR